MKCRKTYEEVEGFQYLRFQLECQYNFIMTLGLDIPPLELLNYFVKKINKDQTDFTRNNSIKKFFE